jgi:hypothetical protein
VCYGTDVVTCCEFQNLASDFKRYVQYTVSLDNLIVLEKYKHPFITVVCHDNYDDVRVSTLSLASYHCHIS